MKELLRLRGFTLGDLLLIAGVVFFLVCVWLCRGVQF